MSKDDIEQDDSTIKALQSALDWLENAPFDYSNGNTDSTGTVDEGNVYGWKGHQEIVNQLRAAIAKAKG